MKRTSVIRQFILPWAGLVFFSLVIAIVGGVEWGVHAAIVSNTVVARNAACTMKSFDSDNDKVVMKLACDGNEDETDRPKFISAYLQKPGPFTCTRYVWAYADCDLQGATKASK